MAIEATARKEDSKRERRKEPPREVEKVEKEAKVEKASGASAGTVMNSATLQRNALNPRSQSMESSLSGSQPHQLKEEAGVCVWRIFIGPIKKRNKITI